MRAYRRFLHACAAIAAAACLSFIGAVTAAAEAVAGTGVELLADAAYLPAVLKKTDDTRNDNDQGKKRKSYSGNVLILDDETAVLEVLRKMLSALGFTVYISRNGNEAIQIFQENINKNKIPRSIIPEMILNMGARNR